MFHPSIPSQAISYCGHRIRSKHQRCRIAGTESSNCPISPATIPPQGSCTLSVAFAPTTWGTAAGYIKIFENDPLASYYSVSFSLTAYSGTLTINPSNLSFGSMAVGQTSPPQTGQVTNSGSSPLYIESVSSTSTSFSESNNCPVSPSTLSAGASCTVTVTFTPSSANYTIASINLFTSSSTAFQQRVDLTGTGLTSAAQISTQALEFGNQAVGMASGTQSVTVSNAGSASLMFSSIGITGTDASDFSIVTNGTTCSTTTSLAYGASCTIGVTFTPSALGARTGMLTIADNAEGSPQTVQLSGSGGDFALAVPSGSSSSETVTPGSAATYSLTLTPEGGFNQAVSLTCTGAPAGAACTLWPYLVTLSGTNAQNIKATVTTTAPTLAPPGPRTGPPAPRGPAIPDWWIALLLMGSLVLASKRRRRAPVVVGAVLLAAIALSCGGGSGGGAGRCKLIAGHAGWNVYIDRDGHLRELDPSNHAEDNRPVSAGSRLEMAWRRAVWRIAKTAMQTPPATPRLRATGFELTDDPADCFLRGCKVL